MDHLRVLSDVVPPRIFTVMGVLRNARHHQLTFWWHLIAARFEKVELWTAEKTSVSHPRSPQRSCLSHAASRALVKI